MWCFKATSCNTYHVWHQIITKKHQKKPTKTKRQKKHTQKNTSLGKKQEKTKKTPVSLFARHIARHIRQGWCYEVPGCAQKLKSIPISEVQEAKTSLSKEQWWLGSAPQVLDHFCVPFYRASAIKLPLQCTTNCRKRPCKVSVYSSLLHSCRLCALKFLLI